MSVEEREVYCNTLSAQLPEYSALINFTVKSIVSTPDRQHEQNATSLINELISHPKYNTMLIDVDVITGGASKMFRPAIQQQSKSLNKSDFMISVK